MKNFFFVDLNFSLAVQTGTRMQKRYLYRKRFFPFLIGQRKKELLYAPRYTLNIQRLIVHSNDGS